MATDINRLVAELTTSIAKDAGPTQAALKSIATKRATTIFNDGVIGLKKDFEESKVTQEIDGGIGASNISNTLDGGPAPDNLFSFIGFEEGDQPTEPIRKAMDPSSPHGPKLGPGIKTQDVKQPTYTFQVKAPDLEAIYAQTPLPWGDGGMSWAEQIERDNGIPDFARFLARDTESKRSRSGGGLQAKGDLPSRGGAQQKAPEQGYLTRMVLDFIASMNTKSYKQRFR
jgi:hypothetical protein